ncbi:MAG: hypothetical protein IT163_13090 [Bryobacterales bacterium]|nr:hypothetical protein [Bryobacterales bacterium]
MEKRGVNRRGFLRALAGVAAAAAAAPAPQLTVAADMAADESATVLSFVHARYGIGFFVETTAGEHDGWIRDWYFAGRREEMRAFEEHLKAQWKAQFVAFDSAFFGEAFSDPAPEGAFTSSNAVFNPAQVCTLETISEAQRQFRIAEADAELDVLLSDDWPIYSAVKRGARPYRVDGRDYLVEVPKAWA